MVYIWLGIEVRESQKSITDQGNITLNSTSPRSFAQNNFTSLGKFFFFFHLPNPCTIMGIGNPLPYTVYDNR